MVLKVLKDINSIVKISAENVNRGSHYDYLLQLIILWKLFNNLPVILL